MSSTSRSSCLQSRFLENRKLHHLQAQTIYLYLPSSLTRARKYTYIGREGVLLGQRLPAPAVLRVEPHFFSFRLSNHGTAKLVLRPIKKPQQCRLLRWLKNVFRLRELLLSFLHHKLADRCARRGATTVHTPEYFLAARAANC